MKIIARQVPPEYQETPVNFSDWFDMWPGMIVHGNRHYRSHTTPVFDSIIDRFDGEKHILRALHLLTGKRHEKHTIRGCCQGDWQDIYYPVADYTPEAIQALEIEYFNLGTEWIITSAEDPEGYSLYCYSMEADEIRKEIANNTGEKPENVILQMFTGWTKTAAYTEV